MALRSSSAKMTLGRGGSFGNPRSGTKREKPLSTELEADTAGAGSSKKAKYSRKEFKKGDVLMLTEKLRFLS